MANLNTSLALWGCRVETFTSGKAAFSQFKRSISDEDPFSVIITGSLTSDLDGFAFSQKIRSICGSEQIAILLLTPSGNPGDAQLCKKTGINGYLTGTIEQKHLHTALLMLLSQSHGNHCNEQKELITRHSLLEVERRQMQILLVEDYPTNQKVTMRHLSNAGYRVDLAENGRIAVEAFQRKGYDLILMDMQMPVMDGYAATRAIRALESKNSGASDPTSAAKHTPIIATTAHAMKGDRQMCLDAGVDDYIIKPLRKANLLKLVEKWIWYENPATPLNRGQKSTPTCDVPDPSTVSALKIPPIDFKRAITEFEGDEEFFLDVLSQFLINVKKQVEILHHAVTQGNAEVVRKEAHSIKGGAADLIAVPLSNLAFELERIGKENRLEEGPSALIELEEEIRHLSDYTAQKYSQKFTVHISPFGRNKTPGI
jgi:CheY-like chemotaxis protein